MGVGDELWLWQRHFLCCGVYSVFLNNVWKVACTVLPTTVIVAVVGVDSVEWRGGGRPACSAPSLRPDCNVLDVVFWFQGLDDFVSRNF
jgi:hypothetical protein